LIAANITVGALFTAIDKCRPTLFIDEADGFIARNGMMRGIITSGNTWRTAYVLRISKAKSHRAPSQPEPAPVPGREETGLQRYSCWCPKVIALIGQTPDTVADRSILVKMSRKLMNESCAPLTELHPALIKAKCVRFALDAGPSLGQMERIRGEGLNDRAADTFEPLYAIARVAGGNWENKLHQAALALTATTWQNNPGAELLLDIITVFLEGGREQMLSSELVGALRSTGGGLRSTALRDSAIDELRIARILRPYGVRSSNIRVGERVNKGYAVVDFREALHRYVPKAAVDARIEEIKRLHKLEGEAKAESEKQEEAQKIIATAIREKSASGDVLSASDLLDRIRALRSKSRGSGAPTGESPQNVAGCSGL
jgi:hypothetical protein